MRELLIDRLKKIKDEGIRSYYVPGHKHGRLIDEYFKDINILEMDFTEIDGTDNLHDPEDILLSVQKNASKYYGSKQAFFLVNGTTCGILSAISSVCSFGDSVITTRDCHKSVYNGMLLNNLHGSYVDNIFDDEFQLSIGPDYEDFKRKIETNLDAKAVILTYPTYNGICYDLKKFIDLSHDYGIPVIIDEAHGAHFRLSDKLPDSAIDFGADIVVQSTHKMLPSLTQSSMLHVCSDRVSLHQLKKYLSIYQSSSPSYLLMASIDIAVDIAEKQGKNLVEKYISEYDRFISELDESVYKNVNNIIMSRYGVKVDPFKINIGMRSDENMKSFESILRCDFGIQCEYSNARTSLFINSIASDTEDMDSLLNALDILKDNYKVNHHDEVEAENDLLRDESTEAFNKIGTLVSSFGIYDKTIYEAFKEEWEQIKLEDSLGRVCSENITPYPPGIPYLIPGERITEGKKVTIEEMISKGIAVEGITCQKGYNFIKTLKK